MKANAFNPARGGHAPGHLRDAFVTCFADPDEAGPWFTALSEEDAIDSRDAKTQGRWNRMSAEDRGRWLLGQLWNCSDVLPGSICGDLDLPAGSTYAMAARKLRSEM